MPSHPIALVSLCLLLAACSPTPEADAPTVPPPPSNAPTVSGAWMGMEPTDTPVMLAPELLASSLDEYNGTFTPDGSVFFYTTNTPGKAFICTTELLDLLPLPLFGKSGNQSIRVFVNIVKR